MYLYYGIVLDSGEWPDPCDKYSRRQRSSDQPHSTNTTLYGLANIIS